MKFIARKLFQWLAVRVLRKYKPLVIGVAGSVGKTATKEAIAAAISSAQRSVRRTEGSFNAEIGVPVTILRGGPAPSSLTGWLGVLISGKKIWLARRPYPQALVLEFGADHPGDLQELIELAKPSVGVLTSTAPEHLEYFGSEEQVITEESLIARMLPSSGTAVINVDDPGSSGLRSKLSGRVVTYGWGPQATVRAESLSISHADSGRPTGMVIKVAVDGSVIPVAVSGVLGRHQAYPILAAVAVAKALGDDLFPVTQRLQSYQPPVGRMRLLEGLNGSLVIDDSYNASPAAVQAAIAALDELEIPGQKYIILGQMSELGSAAARWHDTIGRGLGPRKIAGLITVGPLAKRIGTAAVTAGFEPSKVKNVASAEAAAAILRPKLNAGDAVLLKGSKYPKPGYGGFIRRAAALLLQYPGRDGHLLAPAE